MKYRIKFTAQDYYDYLGRNNYSSLKKKVLTCIPDEFLKKFYNLKFKVIPKYYGFYRHTYYRIQISVDMEEDEIKKVFEKRKDWCYSYTNVSYKPINKTIKQNEAISS